MKRIKLILLFIILFLITPVVSAATKEEVKFSSCVDGDTIKVTIKDEIKTVRFLAVDTPETKHPKKGEEPYGKEASNYTCEKISNAKKIILEYDDNSDKEDKYNRILAWVWVDGELLQKELVENGLAKVAYLYGDYKHTKDLQEIENEAKKNEIGLWGSEPKDKIDIITVIFAIILLIIFIITMIYNQKYRKKIVRKIKKRAKKDISKYIDKVIK